MFKLSQAPAIALVSCFTAHSVAAESIPVSTDNFARAETADQMDRFIAAAGGINTFYHYREPTPIDQQTVIRMNRDTFYSFAVVNISEGATLTLPDAGDRYQSAMIVNEDHFINKVFYGAGTYDLNVDEFDTPFVVVAIRTLVDAGNPEDVKAANAVQDKVVISANSETPYSHPDYDQDSFQGVKEHLLGLGAYVTDAGSTFGRAEDVDAVRHLLGTAGGWGGLPDNDAFYLNQHPNLPVGEYTLTVSDVPAEAFWSVSMYNKDGFFEENDLGRYNVNSVMADRNEDGSVTVNMGGCDDGRVNCLPLTEGWNYIVRLYRPGESILDGSWTFPIPEAVH